MELYKLVIGEYLSLRYDNICMVRVNKFTIGSGINYIYEISVLLRQYDMISDDNIREDIKHIHTLLGNKDYLLICIS